MALGRKTKGTSVPMAIAAGSAAAMGITLAGTGVLAWMLDGEALGLEALSIGSAAVLLLSAVAGSWIGGTAAREKRLAVCMICGLAYMMLLVGIHLFWYEGSFRSLPLTVLSVAGGSLAGALLKPGEERNIKKRRKMKFSG